MKKEADTVRDIYREFDSWNVNLGSKTIHAKRMPGRFRTIKTISQLALWLPFFLLPYLRWNGKQAILLDIEHSQFHFFDMTVWPGDIWMLALAMLAASMLMFAVTAVASRVWCGYFCFQTAWTDWFTWIEEKIEGHPVARKKLDAAPWGAAKLGRKFAKHAIWLLISLITAISFSIWFVDAFEYWGWLRHIQLPRPGWITLAAVTCGTYLYAGLMREQVCLWMCPYARFQAVMADTQTLMPTYDLNRGEPRGKLRQGNPKAETQGDCIDCHQCAQVCPTGIDIRQGQQLGCITCGLCIDACDSVMDKVGKPRGLIRYASQDEMAGLRTSKPHRQPRTLIYAAILLAALTGIAYGLVRMSPIALRVTPERQPMFALMSDGSIQNKYELRVMNKTSEDMRVIVTAEGGIPGMRLIGAENPLRISHGHGVTFSLLIRAPREGMNKEVTPVKFKVQSLGEPVRSAEYDSYFNGPSSPIR